MIQWMALHACAQGQSDEVGRETWSGSKSGWGVRVGYNQNILYTCWMFSMNMNVCVCMKAFL